MDNPKNQAFENFLKKEEEKKTQKVDWNSRKEEWVHYIKVLYNDVENWLKTYKESGQVAIFYSDLDMFEESLGSYTVQELTITVGSNFAKLTPIGAIILGSRGRVDLTGRFGSKKFILADKDSTKPNIRFRIVLSDEDEKKYQEEQKNKPKKDITWVWKISSNPPTIEYTELNQDTFFENLIYVINGQ